MALLESTNFSGELISVTAKSKYYLGALTPRFTYDDVVTSAPAVGQISTWNNETVSFEQWIKTEGVVARVSRPGVNPQVIGRLSSTQINSFKEIEDTGQKLLTSQGVNIPIVYGRSSVAGYIFAEGETGGNKFVGVAWCMGEVNSIERVFINDEVVPTSVAAKHYRGTTTQTVSPALQTYTATSPQFSDDMVLRTPAGNIGICYSVFNIPTSAVTGAPRFRAIIQGRIVADPTSTATSPYESYTEWSFDFLSGITDSGPNSYTLTLNGDAGIASPSVGLALDGTGDYATIPDGTEIAALPFTLEIEVLANTAASSPGTQETIITKGSTASPLSRSIQIDRLGDELLLYLSSDGSTWDIASGLSCGTLAATGSPEVVGRILIERVDNQISTYLNGVTQSGVVTTSALYSNSEVWTIGAEGTANEFNGLVKSARLTIGAYRYGSPHAITNTPFSDSGNYTAGVVYSENPILCAADLASDPVIGLGATTTGVAAAAAYCDTALSTGAPRCRIGISMSEPRLVEAWLDQLVTTYGNGLWFPEGSDIKFIADRSQADGQSGSGPELYTATSPEFGSPLPAITTEDGVEYSINFTIDTAATTSPLVGVAVNFGGVEVIAEKTTAGTHGVRVTASGTSNTIEVLPNVLFDGTWSGLSVKRTHRAVTQWMKSTLSLQGLPEGDKPNAVEVSYNIPDTESGAWKTNTFPVVNAAVVAGDPIVLTKISLPGVNRIEEASNKAIATLYRNDRKTRVSLVSTDEEFVAQPGDTVQVTGSNRGINTPVWVESNRMVSYGRHQITGMLYRDNQYPDLDYALPKKFDTEGPAEEASIGGPYNYSCSSYEDYLAAHGSEYAVSYTASDIVPLAYPFTDGGSPTDGKWRYYINFSTSPAIIGTYNSPSVYISTADYSAMTFPDFCSGTPLYLLCIDGKSLPSNRNALIPAEGDDRWGDNVAQMLITGLDGGSDISGTLMTGVGKRWLVTFGSASNFHISNISDCSVSAATSGNDVTITLSVAGGAGGEGYTTTSTSFEVLDVGDTLQLITMSISSTDPFQVQLPTRPVGWTGLVIDVTITCTYAGTTGTVTGRQYLGYGEQYVPTNLSVAQALNTFLTLPRLFFDARCSVASMLWGTTEINTTTSATALSRNYL